MHNESGFTKSSEDLNNKITRSSEIAYNNIAKVINALNYLNNYLFNYFKIVYLNHSLHHKTTQEKNEVHNHRIKSKYSKSSKSII